MSKVNLITTCTNGKHGTEDNILHLGDYSAAKTPYLVLIKAWTEALNKALSNSTLIRVKSLYKGGHWATAKSICQHDCVELWVLSAGFGLLHAEDKIVPYQATFAVGHRESIPLYSNEYNGKGFYRTWWKQISENSPFKDKHPTSIADLMRDNSKDYFVISGSPDYINAIEIDIINGLRFLKSSNKQLVIITSKNINPRLNEYFFKSDARMAHWLKCNMLMLNISLAKYIINQFVNNSLNDIGELSKSIYQELQSLPERKIVKGQKRTPEEVEKYILELQRQNPQISATQALRTFRDSGNSFEEKRFRGLFQTVTNLNG